MLETGPFQPQMADYEEQVRRSFARQRAMATLGARLRKVEPGVVEVELDYREELTQQHGFLHAGIVTAVVDSACGYAAYSLMPADASVLTAEYKVNLLAPAAGARFLARGSVIKPGRTLTVCLGTVHALGEGEPKLIATMMATMATIMGRPDVSRG